MSQEYGDGYAAGEDAERARWVGRLRVWRRWFVLADDMIDSSVLLEELDKDFPEIKDSYDAE